MADAVATLMLLAQSRTWKPKKRCWRWMLCAAGSNSDYFVRLCVRLCCLMCRASPRSYCTAPDVPPALMTMPMSFGRR